MPRTTSRATISSLKATHTAHRMANEIFNPRIPLPPPTQAEPSSPFNRPSSDGVRPTAKRRRRHASFSLKGMGLAELVQVGVIVFVALLVLLLI